MKKLVNEERLVRTFLDLVRIDSPSRHEREVCNYIRSCLEEIGARVTEDDSHKVTGSNCGNLYVHIDGDGGLTPVFFNAHMDTVEPGCGVKPIVSGGVIKSDGTTILGADDKAAIAILIEVARILKENSLHHPPVDYLFTTCEEIGLLGAKEVRPELLRARDGYALDAPDPLTLITKAPTAIRFKIIVKGKAAHAGIAPEDGINSIYLASKAISRLKLGRIDDETTCNIGLIQGGKATNIIPEETIINGEVRSHSQDKLKKVQDEIISSFIEEARIYREVHKMSKNEHLPTIHVEVTNDYPLMDISSEHKLVRIAKEASLELNAEIKTGISNGGSDANILNGKGLNTVVMGIGMQKVHSTSEYIEIKDMVFVTNLVLNILRKWN